MLKYSFFYFLIILCVMSIYGCSSTNSKSYSNSSPSFIKNNDQITHQISQVRNMMTSENWERASKILVNLNRQYPGNAEIESYVRRVSKLIVLSKSLDAKDLAQVNPEFYKAVLRQKASATSSRKISLKDSLKFLTFVAGGAYLLKEALKSSSPPRYTGTLHISLKMDSWLGGRTATKFTVKITGDSSTGYYKDKKSGGSGFWDNKYVNFYYVPLGGYDIKIYGYDEIGNVAFNVGGNINYSSGNSMFCDIYNNGYVSCR